MDKNTIICRCEEITVSEIEEAIAAGCTSIKSIKKFTRAGMGSCQGRICASSIASILRRRGIDVTNEDKPAFPAQPILISEMEE